MSQVFQELVSQSFTRVLPLLATSNFLLYGVSQSTGVVTWVDFGWVLNHTLAGIYYFYLNNGQNSPQGKFYLGLLLFWSGRLGYHLLKRCLSGHSDPRYNLVSNRWNLRKSVLNLIQFEFQAILTVFTSIPMFFLFRNLSTTSVLALEAKNMVGAGLVGMGIIGQWVADHQLENFKKAPIKEKAEGKEKPLCKNGIWKYSRHPNLFFEFCVWTGFGVLGYKSGQPQTCLALAGVGFLYLIVDFLSTRITEKHMSSSRPSWKEHKAKTNKYFPFFKL